jgi:hypothetical protein
MKDFISYEDLKDALVVQTASMPIYIKGFGAVLIKHEVTNKHRKKTITTVLHPVYYIPVITTRLLSLGVFLQEGMHVYGNATKLSIAYRKSLWPVLECTPHIPSDTVYWLKSKVADQTKYSTMTSVDYNLMHKHLGHPSQDVLRHAPKNTKGFPPMEVPEEIPICPGCAEGKMPSKAYPPSETHAEKPFEKIHSDIKSFPVALYHKYKYFISFVDDYSSYSWVTLLCTKSAAINALTQFLALVKNQYNTTVKQWMSDAGGEYKSDIFIKTLKDNGIKVLQSIPYTPQQNGCAECFMCTCMDKAQAMWLEACFPQSWWEFAVEHAVHCYNRTPVHCIQWCTPYELMNKE